MCRRCEEERGFHGRNRGARQGLSRRGLLAGAIGGAIAMPSLELDGGALFATAQAQTALSPDKALEDLVAGNARFAANQLTSLAADLDILKQHTVDKQEPFAAVLACADSRVPVELIFDQTIGHLFVTRVAGNICTPEIIASLEYGAAVLGVAVIVVLGHDGCGAVKAAIAAKDVPGQISALYAPLRPAVQRAGSDLVKAIEANAAIQAELLRTASPVIAGLAKQAKLKVVPARYELASGKVTFLA